MREKTKKATFNIHVTVLDAVDEAMARGMARSKNALVEQALIKEVKELRRQRRKTLWQEAARDALFLSDIKQVEDDFRYADAETAGKIDL
jgi:tRNA A37 N6-isopentenylltransferase MiaA